MNTIPGIALIVAAIYFLYMAIGGFLGSATGQTWDGVKIGAVIATILTGFGAIIGAAVWVLTA